MKKITLFIFCLFTSLFLFAQRTTSNVNTVSITGKIIDAKTNQPLEYATVVLKNIKTTKISGGITDEKGNFNIKTPKGKYEISVNRWRQESGKRMVENYAGDKEIKIKDAWLKVGSIEQVKTIDNKMHTAKFEVDLKEGATCFEATINLFENGKTIRPECIYVTYVGESNKKELEGYVASDPDEILKEGY